MATTCFPITTATDYAGAAVSSTSKKTLTINGTRGAGATTITDNTAAGLAAQPLTTTSTPFSAVGANGGSTPGFDVLILASTPICWITPALSAVTIAGSITVNFRGSESNAMANYGGGAGLFQISGDTATLIGAGGNSTEFGTSEAARSFTITPTSTALADGDRLCIYFLYGGAGGSSASGFTASFVYAGASGATGDVFVTFTETLAAQGGAAAASLVYSGTRRSYGAMIVREPVACFLNALNPRWRSRRSGLLVPAYT